MSRTYVTSSNLHSVGYDSQTETLEIEFNDGAIYQYEGVSEVVYEELMSAPSHGKYFHAHIKDAYPYRRVN